MGVTRKALQQKCLDWEPSERPKAGKLGFFGGFIWMLEVLNVDSQIDLDRLHCFFRFNANPVGFKNLPLRIVKCTYWTPTNTC